MRGQDGWILAKLFFRSRWLFFVFMDLDSVLVHKRAKKERLLLEWILHNETLKFVYIKYQPIIVIALVIFFLSLKEGDI